MNIALQGFPKLKTTYSMDFAVASLPRITLASAVPLGTSHTVAVWVKPRTQTGSFNFGPILGDTSNTNPISFNGLNNNVLLYAMGAGGATVNITSLTGDWHHLACTRVDTAVTFYVDGVAAGSATLPANTAANPNLIALRDSATKLYYNGIMADLRCYSAVLSPSVIADIANNRFTPNPDLGWWTFNEGSGSTTNDATARLDNGTLVAGATYVTDVPPLLK